MQFRNKVTEGLRVPGPQPEQGCPGVPEPEVDVLASVGVTVSVGLSARGWGREAPELLEGREWDSQRRRGKEGEVVGPRSQQPFLYPRHRPLGCVH